MIPFGAEISYLPITAKDNKKQHALGSKTRKGIFLGYSQQSGGTWNGDLLILDWGEMENAQTIAAIHIKRLKAKEVIPTMRGELHNFPCADGKLRQPGSSHLEIPSSDPFASPRGDPEAIGDGDPAGQEEEDALKEDPDVRATTEDPSEQDYEWRGYKPTSSCTS